MKKFVATVFAMCLAVPASADFGAIYYDDYNGAHGFSKGFSNRADAEAFAFQYCSSYGTGCQRAVWYQDACGAVAKAGNGAWGADWGANYREAELKALQACRNYSNNARCEIVVSACSNE